MNTRLWHGSAFLVIAGLIIMTLAGCVAAGGGYDGNVGVGVDYYEPVGGVYGVWGPAYQVGPYRDGGHRWDGGSSGPHAYRPAAGTHTVPSIPSRSRTHH